MWLRKRSCWVCKVTTVVSVWLESVAAPYGILLLSPLFPTSLRKILLAFHTFQVLHHTACVTLNAGFKNQKHQRRESIWIRKAIVHFPLTLFPQRNVNLNKWIYRIIGAAVHSFFLSWCLVGLFPTFQSQSPNELQGDRSLSITGYFSTIVISAPSENHKAWNN